MNKNKIIFLAFILIIACMFFMADNFDTNLNINHNGPHILNLVLYSTDNGGSYDKMKELTQSYYKKFPRVKTVYYRFEKNIQTPYALKDNTLLIKGEETYIPGILQKTVNALEYFKPTLNEYDYVIRSNISTIIQFDKLSDELQINPVQYGCGLCWGIEHVGKKEHLGNIYSSGTSIILSSETVVRILENKEFIDETVIDDVSIGKLIAKKLPDVEMKNVFKNVPNNGFAFVPNFNKETENTLNQFMDEKSDQIVFYRNHNGDRELDVSQMTQIIDYLLQAQN
jgi:hypothetical protein